ncbi:hypothetical protein MKX03_021523 [Papaver bracteatum]|nr:hypothetical protein MKX03_021523 [Papaver bracteatum]
MALKVSPLKAAEIAIQSIGLGYDIAIDLRLKYCKRDTSNQGRVVLPGGISIQSVSKSIKCDKGERMRFSSDVLSFQQFSWQKDAANKTLAFDGWFITLYTVALAKSQPVLRDHVRQKTFIEKFGTHIIVGVKMGGKDVIYLKQQHSLKEMADKRFRDTNGQFGDAGEVYDKGKVLGSRTTWLRFVDTSPSNSYAHKEGSDNKNLTHSEWIHTVQVEPDVISMSFVPITSLLNEVPGSGFLSHAINLYLDVRISVYKPPIEELHQFLEFQLPRQWAPVFSELPLEPHFMGPRLYVNTSLASYWPSALSEGKRSNRLAIHMQHLSSLPKVFQLHDDPNENSQRQAYDRKYYEKVQWKNFSHVCTAPVESDEDLSIVTGAYFHVGDYGLKKILFASSLRHSFWCHYSQEARVGWVPWSGPEIWNDFLLISSHFHDRQKSTPIVSRFLTAPKLLKFVDTTEMTRGRRTHLLLGCFWS